MKEANRLKATGVYVEIKRKKYDENSIPGNGKT